MTVCQPDATITLTADSVNMAARQVLKRVPFDVKACLSSVRKGLAVHLNECTLTYNPYSLAWLVQTQTHFL